MGKKSIQVFFLFLFIPLFLLGQCPDAKQLWNRLTALRDSSRVSYKRQLRELLNYEASPTCTIRNDSVRVLLFQTISKLYLDNLEYDSAIKFTNKAIEFVSGNAKSSSIKPECQVKNYYDLASAYNALKNRRDEIKAYDSCIANAIRLNVVSVHLLYCLLEDTRYLNSIGEYTSSINRAEIGEVYSHRYIPDKRNIKQGDSTYFILNFANEKSTALYILKEFKKAETFLHNKIDEYKTKDARNSLGSLYEQLALINFQRNKDVDAFAYFKLALNCYKLQNDTISYKIAIHNIGYSIYQELRKDDDKALSWFKKALGYKVRDYDASRSDSINCINIYSSIANVYVRKSKFDSAQYYFQCAFDQIKKGTNEVEVVRGSLDEFMQKQKVEYVTGLLIDKGSAFYEQFKFSGGKDTSAIKKAIKMYKRTDEFLERIKINQLEFQSKLFWRKDTHQFYEKAIAACKAGNSAEDAFYFFERSRAVLLYDQMDEQKWLGENDILKRRDLVNKIGNAEKKLEDVNISSVNYLKVKYELSQLKKRISQSDLQIKERNPLYYQSFMNPKSTSISDIRRYLSSNKQTLLEIFTGDSIVYSMIITTDTIYFNQVNKADYDTESEHCIAYMVNADILNGKREFKSFIKSSERLYNLIFKNCPVPLGRIIVSSDGHHFPFESLVINVKNDQPVYFVQKYAVSYAYSARFLMSQVTPKSSFTPGSFLGIAPVIFPSNPPLPALPGSDIAIENTKSFYHEPQSLLRDEATSNTFMKVFGKYQIVQLYSHSSDTSDKSEPLIYFADKPMYLSELSNMETPLTKLVVLSACETGKGQLYQGEGVFSFNRAFAALGIPSCVNNLWSVDDESTYKITRLFHKYISEGLSIDVALQKAKIEYMETATSDIEKRPYYWAPGILTGKADAIQFQTNSDHKAISIVILVLVSLLLIVLLSLPKNHPVFS